MNKPKCPSCHKPLEAHMGLTGTCQKLLRARQTLRDIRLITGAYLWQFADPANIRRMIDIGLDDSKP